MRAPESGEGSIEDWKLLVTMNQQCTAGVMHLVACAEVDMPKGVDDIQQTPWMHVDAGPPQQAAEEQQVIEQS